MPPAQALEIAKTVAPAPGRRCLSARYDIVLFGATGFTGGLTAEYLAAQRARRDALGARRAEPEQARGRPAPARRASPRGGRARRCCSADAGDADIVRAIAEATKVVITTVGPYIHYGEPLVAACAAAGTDYVDLTGEPEFVDAMWLRHHEQAQRSGARIVHSCGFDSIPYDLGVLFTVEQLPEGVPIRVEGFVQAGGTFSGGTYHSAINAFARLRQIDRRSRASAASRSRGRRAGAFTAPPGSRTATTSSAAGWCRSRRSIRRPCCARRPALERYGPDFTYSHYLVTKRLPVTVGLALGAGGAVALAQLPPTRKLLLKIKDPGEGPTPEQRAKAWFRVRFAGEGGGKRVLTEVVRRRPGLRRDVEDARRVGAVPGPRRAAGDARGR